MVTEVENRCEVEYMWNDICDTKVYNNQMVAAYLIQRLL